MPAKLPYCVYVLRSMQDGNFYVGFTTDLARRLTEHFQGQSRSTAPRRPFCLLFCEYFFSKEDAMRREMYLKTTAGRKGLKLILRATLAAISKMTRNELIGLHDIFDPTDSGKLEHFTQIERHACLIELQSFKYNIHTDHRNRSEALQREAHSGRNPNSRHRCD